MDILHAPLECRDCHGFGTFRGDLPCDRCRCTGLVQCDHCDEHPTDAPAVGCDPTDTDIKLCASCIAKPCEWCGKALSDAEAHGECWNETQQARAERIACGGEAWSGGFAENH